ncbi:MAG: hypothetical protein JWN98_901 [Abditibacteriota bacterium]|nr:hypothetical protein [Abditibacteriota bacterium]
MNKAARQNSMSFVVNFSLPMLLALAASAQAQQVPRAEFPDVRAVIGRMSPSESWVWPG